jgi:hypothetical protein
MPGWLFVTAQANREFGTSIRVSCIQAISGEGALEYPDIGRLTPSDLPRPKATLERAKYGRERTKNCERETTSNVVGPIVEKGLYLTRKLTALSSSTTPTVTNPRISLAYPAMGMLRNDRKGTHFFQMLAD